MKRRMTIATVGLAALLALAGCGRKGPLEPPPGVSPDMAKGPGCVTQPVPHTEPVDTMRSPTIPSGTPSQIPASSPPPC